MSCIKIISKIVNLTCSKLWIILFDNFLKILTTKSNDNPFHLVWLSHFKVYKVTF